MRLSTKNAVLLLLVSYTASLLRLLSLACDRPVLHSPVVSPSIKCEKAAFL